MQTPYNNFDRRQHFKTTRAISKALAYAVTASIVCATFLAAIDSPAWGWVLAFGVAILGEILYSR